MNKNWIIREAILSDLDACVALDANNFNIYNAQKRKEHFKEMIPRKAMLVIVDNQKIAAYASFEPDWFGCTFLKLVVVDTPYRRRGLASSLIRYIEKRHCPSKRFFSSTEDDNNASKAMHTRLGFKESGWLDNLPQPHREIFYFKQVK